MKGEIGFFSLEKLMMPQNIIYGRDTDDLQRTHR